MGASEDQLRSQIAKVRDDLARDLSELKVEASRAARQAAMIAGGVVAAYIGVKVLMAVLRRRRR